ncbi:MAG: exopolysaccharide biosynthesis polyprenyl glycosylphosphotransferase [Oscillospiraceae bacterium]|nr:exopolysaccharide biosynthesis polyprenyl glycosylphosphotransferase [Oscillospiraceae bacterium]
MKKNRYLLRFWSPLFLLIFQSGIWAFVWISFYSGDIPRQIYWKGHLLVAAVYFVILFVITAFYGGLRSGDYSASDVSLSGMISLVFANIIAWAQTCLVGTAIMAPLPIIVMTAAQCIIVWRWAVAMHKLYARTAAPRRMLMLHGGSETAKRLAYKLTGRADKYQIQESLSVSEHSEDEVFSRIPEFEAVVLCDIPAELYGKIHALCFKRSIRVYTVPSIQDILTRSAAQLSTFDTPMLLSRNGGLSEERRVIKRIFDLAVAGAALVLFSPIVLVTALLIKLYDGGPAVYSQERLTLGGRRFMLYKLRSMSVDAEKGGARLSAKNDGRVTPIGKIIRPLRIDELPQLVNILKGDMSIVGPRPERPEIAEEYLEFMPEFEYRLKVKAGLTGYAQVYGAYNTDPWDKLLMDLIYISGYSLMLDFKIMLMTVKILLLRDRTAGIEDGKITPRRDEN